MNQSAMNTLFFGSRGAFTNPIQDTGGQTVTFRGPDGLVSIQIGQTVYGAPEGTIQAQFDLGELGQFVLKKLESNSQTIQYIQIECNGVEYRAGYQRGTKTMLNVNMTVEFKAIQWGQDGVSAIEFNIIN